MLKYLWLIAAGLLMHGILRGQSTMHDASFKDTDGLLHRLYADYLDQNKVVVFKFFFTTCPPCISNAPSWQQKYLQHGGGNQQVQFFNVTTITSDSDAKVSGFENTHGQTMPGVSHDGMAANITNPFKNGIYGNWYGTPSFAVISPNKKLRYPVLFSELDQAISLAKTEKIVIPSTYTLQILSSAAIPDGHVQWWLRDANAPQNAHALQKNNQGFYQFTYPSASFPAMGKPEIYMESLAPASNLEIKASDILPLVKHIIGLDTLNDPRKKLAADVNGSGTVSASDVLVLRKIILGLETNFPNNTPSYRQYSGPVSLPSSTGSAFQVQTEVIRMGKVR